MEIQKKVFKIYALPHLKITKDNYDYFKYQSSNIDKIIKKLQKDKGYNLRIEPNERCIVYGDYDHCTLEQFIKFLEYLCYNFEIKMDEISYTSSKNNTSFHYSIPSLETTPSNIYLLFGEKKFDSYRMSKINPEKSCLDLSVYCNHWFRLPNQTLEGKPEPHIIIKGEIQDFIITYTDNTTENLIPIEKEEKDKILKDSDFKYKGKKTKYEYIEQLVDLLDIKRAEDFQEWTRISFIINNELGKQGLPIFKLFSSQSTKYDTNKDDKWYLDLESNESGLFLGSLINYAKIDSLEEYEILKKKFIKFDAKDSEEKQEEVNNNILDSDDNYNKLKIEFEKNNFKILNPLMFIIVYENNEMVIHDKKKFQDVYQNLLYTKYNEVRKKMVPTSFVNDWLEDPKMRTYYKLDFLPKQIEPKNIYNTFKYFEVEKKPLIKTDILNSLIIKHIKNLCNNDNDVYWYVMRFLARKVQNPKHLTNTALIFKSDEGAGKDLFFNWFGNKIIGSDYYYNTEKPALLFGKFTSSLENKILIVVNETSEKDTYSINENIKSAITAETNIIERKGIDEYKNTNHIGYIFLTNNDSPFKISIKDKVIEMYNFL